MILTGDHDVEEEFLKMIELITIHYFAMLVAREYKRDPVSFHPRVIDVDEAAVQQLFEAATLLDLGSRRVQDFRPATIEFVPISCCLVGHYFSQLTYGAKTAMSAILEVKDRTGGRSTDLFGERDVHAYFVPEFPKIPGRHAALISRDVREMVGARTLDLRSWTTSPRSAPGSACPRLPPRRVVDTCSRGSKEGPRRSPYRCASSGQS